MSSKEKESIHLLLGTLDLIVLRTLAAMGPRHAYQIATRLQQVSDSLLTLNQGTLYPALVLRPDLIELKSREHSLGRVARGRDFRPLKGFFLWESSRPKFRK